MEEIYIIFWHNKYADSVRTCFAQEYVRKSKLKEEIERIKKICGPAGYYVYNNQSREKV